MGSRVTAVLKRFPRPRSPFGTKEGRRSAFAVIAVNTLITVGFLARGWDLTAALLFFCIEWVIFSLFGFLKLLLTVIRNDEYAMADEGPVLKAYFIALLSAAYLALIVLLAFMVALFVPLFIERFSGTVVVTDGGDGVGGIMRGLWAYLLDNFFGFQRPVTFMNTVRALRAGKGAIVVLLFASHCYVFADVFLRNKLYLQDHATRLIVRPLAHFFVLYGYLGLLYIPLTAFMEGDSKAIAVTIWMVCKTLFDLYGDLIDRLAE